MKKLLMLLACMGSVAAFAEAPREAVRGEQPFKIGLAGFTCHKFTIEQTLEMMQQVDLHYLCIKDFHLPFKSTDEEIAAFKKKLEEAHVTGYAIGPIYSSTEADIDRDFAFAKRVGVNLIVGVPVKNVDGKKTANPELLKYIDAKVKETNIRYAIHNHGPDNLPYSTANETWEYIRDLDKRIGFCLDIGHNARSGEDPDKALLQYAERIYDIHWKNVTAFTKEGRSTQVSRGKLNYVSFVETLRKIKYTGVCSLEYEKDMDKPLVGIAESVGYFKGIIDGTR